MEKFLGPFDKEYMRMAMLKHEETFRKQVYELHRLYHIQKILMKDFESRRANWPNQDGWNSKNGDRLNPINDYYARHQKPRQHLDLEQPAEGYTAELEGHGHGVLEIEDESKIELTLGPACYYQGRKEERPLTSDSGISFCSSTTGSNRRKKTSLEFSQKVCKKIEESTGQNWGLFEVPETNSRFLGGGRKSSNSEEQLRQDGLKQPLWLFQTCSLNLT